MNSNLHLSILKLYRNSIASSTWESEREYCGFVNVNVFPLISNVMTVYGTSDVMSMCTYKSHSMSWVCMRVCACVWMNVSLSLTVRFNTWHSLSLTVCICISSHVCVCFAYWRKTFLWRMSFCCCSLEYILIRERTNAVMGSKIHKRNGI